MALYNKLWQWCLLWPVVFILASLLYTFYWKPDHEMRNGTKWSLGITNEVLYAVLVPNNQVLAPALMTINRSIQVDDKSVVCLLATESGANRGTNLWLYAPHHWTYNKTLLLKLVCRTQGDLLPEN